MNSLLDKITRLTELEILHLAYLYKEDLIGLCSKIFNRVKIPHINPIPEEYFDAFIEGLYNGFYNGIEPEFETEESYKNHLETLQYLKECKYMLEDPNLPKHKRKSPYKDTTKPFLGHD